MISRTDERHSSLGTALESAMKWGIPASPLFLAVLMLIAHAPYASPIVDPSLFYLACMVGALCGFAGCLPVRTWDRAALVGTCWFAGIMMEASWFVLLFGETSGSAAALLAGSVLAGASTAWLLVLWLWVDQTDSLTCEVAKIACVFFVAFALYSLFSVVPHGGAISYLFPVATCVPLTVFLRAEAPARHADAGRTAGDEAKAASGPAAGTASTTTVGDRRERTRRPSIGRTLLTGLLLASFGAGFSALGFGGERAEQGAGLLALVLVVCLFLTPGRIDLLRVVSTPLVAFSLCYDALAGHGNAFAFFLTGCGSFVVWLFLQHRFGWERPRTTTPRAIALRLLFIALSAGAGMALGQLALNAFDVAGSERLFVLVCVVVLADLCWRVARLVDIQASPLAVRPRAGSDARQPQAPEIQVLGGEEQPQPIEAQETSRGEDAPRPDAPAPDARLAAFEQSWGLSPREAQVAELLCQSRSVSYISQTLGMATSTTKTHVRHVYEKAGVHSRSELQLLVERGARRP